MKFIKIENLTSNPQVKVVSLDRPEIKNAFHPEMIFELTSFFQQASTDKNLKLIILRGEGTAFCAGADLNWMKSMVNFSKDENLEDSRKLWAMFDSIQKCSVPVIAIAHGAVFGGGLGLLVACDYVFAETATQYCFSEVKLGLAPAVISGFISRKIQDSFYRPLMISGEVFKSDRAFQVGIAHRLFETVISSDDVAKMFNPNGLEAMREAKKLLNSLLTADEEIQRRELCIEVIADRRMSAEGQERLKNFLSK